MQITDECVQQVDSTSGYIAVYDLLSHAHYLNVISDGYMPDIVRLSIVQQCCLYIHSFNSLVVL